MCLSCRFFRKILATIFFFLPSFPPSPIRGIYLGNLLKRVAGACIMHEMQSLFLHSTVCIQKQDWNRVPARKMNISSSKKKKGKKMPIYLKEGGKKKHSEQLNSKSSPIYTLLNKPARRCCAQHDAHSAGGEAKLFTTQRHQTATELAAPPRRRHEPPVPLGICACINM